MPYPKVAALYAIVTVLLLVTLAALAPRREVSNVSAEASASKAER